jgi:hypothetical protein
MSALFRTIVSQKRSRRAGVSQSASPKERKTRLIPTFTPKLDKSVAALGEQCASKGASTVRRGGVGALEQSRPGLLPYPEALAREPWGVVTSYITICKCSAMMSQVTMKWFKAIA